MNYASRTTRSVPAISLAEQSDFVLGGMSVSPSAREVRAGERREVIEPRVMQVFVVLAQAHGAVVSREHLVERCWGGRIVGDDAINNAVMKVRGLAALLPDAAFEIETIPRVGYRLRARGVEFIPEAEATAEVAPAPSSARWPRIPIWLVAAALILVLAAAALFFYPARPHEWIIVESHMPFISTPLIERYPAFSPDGTMIAYSAGPDVMSRKIYLRLKSGGDPLRLTDDSFDAYFPAWSPDGSMIAYLGYDAQQPCRILLVPVPTGASRQVARCRTNLRSSLAWDRDGHSLLYADSPSIGQPPRILRLDPDNGTTTELTHPTGTESAGDSAPSISPDGKTMLFIRDLNDGKTQVILREQARGTERVLMQDTADSINAAWSTDSSAVFVTGDRQGDSSLWAWPVSAAAPWRITTSPVPISRPSSGPDGLLAMELEFSDIDLAEAPTSAGLEPRAVDRIGLNACLFDYAPDGTIVLLAHRSGVASIWLGDPDGRFRELVRLNADQTCGIRWSPDGKRFAYGVAAKDGFAVVVMDRNGAPVARIPNATREFGSIDWSADGKCLLLSRLDAHGRRMWRIDINAPHTSVPILPYGWDFVRARGNELYGVREGLPGVWRIDGNPHRLTDWPNSESPWLWTLSGDRIIYPDYSDRAHPVFMAQPVNGAARYPVGYPTGLSIWGNIAVDPKTGHVTYARWKRDDTDIGWIRLSRDAKRAFSIHGER